MDILKIKEELKTDQSMLLHKDCNHNVAILEFRAEGLEDTIGYIFQYLLACGYSEESIKKYIAR